MTSRNFVLLAALFGFLGVAAGAFGAHGLSAYFAAHPDLQDDFPHRDAVSPVSRAGADRRGVGGGTLSGALVALGGVSVRRRDRPVFGQPVRARLSDLRIMGAVAPLGGLALLGGWAVSGAGGVAGIETG